MTQRWQSTSRTPAFHARPLTSRDPIRGGSPSRAPIIPPIASYLAAGVPPGLRVARRNRDESRASHKRPPLFLARRDRLQCRREWPLMYASEIAPAAPRFGDSEDSHSEPPGVPYRALLSAPQSPPRRAPVRWLGMERAARPPRGPASQVGEPVRHEKPRVTSTLTRRNGTSQRRRTAPVCARGKRRHSVWPQRAI